MDFHFTVYKSNESIDLSMDSNTTMRDIYKKLMKRNDLQHIYIRIKERGNKFQYDLNYKPSVGDKNMIIIKLDKKICMYMGDIDIIENNNFDDPKILELNWRLDFKTMMISSFKVPTASSYSLYKIESSPIDDNNFISYRHVCEYECSMIERYDFVILDGILVIGILRKCIKSGLTKEITFKIKASFWYW